MIKKNFRPLTIILLMSYGCSVAQTTAISTDTLKQPQIQPSSINAAIASVSPRPQPTITTDTLPQSNTLPNGQTGATTDISQSSPYDNNQNIILPTPQISASYNPDSVSHYNKSTPLTREIIKKEGATGSYIEVLNKIALPIAVNYSDDIKLFSVLGGVDKSGVTINRKLPPSVPDMYNPPPYYEWKYYFVSRKKNETYFIRVNYLETIISIEKWQDTGFISSDFDINEVKIDSTNLVEIFEMSIKDKSFKSDKINRPISPLSTVTEAYSLPSERDYSLELKQNEKELSWYIYSSDRPDSEFINQFYFPKVSGSSGSYESGTAKIDARTGEVLKLTRPTYIYSPPQNVN